jgi:hypothetical protein
MSIGAISASIPANSGATSQVNTKTKATATTAAAPVTNTTPSTATTALEEATETSADTVKEAAHGDRVAQRLIAKQHLASASNAPAETRVKGSVNGSGQVTGEVINVKA